MVKEVLLTTILGVSLWTCQNRPDRYTIHGNIAGNAEGAKVFLQEKDGYPPVNVDSAIIRDGKFLLKGHVTEPSQYFIFIDNSQVGENEEMTHLLRSPIYLENTDITYSGHIDSLQTLYWSEKIRKSPVITGSATQELYDRHQESMKALEQKYRELFDQYLEVYLEPAMEGQFNTAEGVALSRQIAKVRDAQNIARWEFIEQHPASVVAYDETAHFLEGMFVNLTAGQIDHLVDIIGKHWKTHPEKFAAFKAKAEKAKKMAIGTPYHDIELTNIEGKNVRLSEYIPKGKYVLLEFWASWCGPCRAEIPHLKHIYQEYQKKGFEIVSVSIDAVKTDWDKALKEEGMSWTQLCDFKGQNGPVTNVYNVLGVPSCFLLDKEGRIFKNDMRGAALDAELQVLLP